MSNQEKFSDRLIAAEHVDATRKERYEMEMQRLYNPTLTPAKRIRFGVMGMIGLLVGVTSVYNATIHIYGDYAWVGHLVFGIASAFGFVAAYFYGKAAIKGTMNLKKALQDETRVTWFWTVFVTAILLILGGLGGPTIGRHHIEPAYMGTWAVVYLLFGAVFVILKQMEMFQLRNREQFLKIELKLAELTDSLAKKDI